jgi:hypothetical protein
MYVLFKTDDHHSKASQELLGVATTKEHLIRLAKKVAREEEAEFTKEDVISLSQNLQTQGYEDGEFLAYDVNINEIIE